METMQVDQPYEGVTRITLDRPESTERHERGPDRGAPRRRSPPLPWTVCAGSSSSRVPAGASVPDSTSAATAPRPDRRTSTGSGPPSPPRPTLRRSSLGCAALPQPVIAAVNGPAAGGGLALALASDIRIASASARFNVAFVRLGLSGCDIGVSWLLPRLIGASRAWELMLTGRIIDAAEADRIGLVLRVVADDELQSVRSRLPA